MDPDDQIAISVERVCRDGSVVYVGTLTVNDGLPIDLGLFRRVVPVSGEHTDESAKAAAYSDCLRFCYYYNPENPAQETGMTSDA